jgi:hypothetical protein
MAQDGALLPRMLQAEGAHMVGARQQPRFSSHDPRALRWNGFVDGFLCCAHLHQDKGLM